MANGGQMPDWLIPAAAGVPSGAPSIPTPGTNMALKVNTTNGHLYAYVASAWIDVTGTGGGGGALTVSQAQLSADVTMTTATTYYDGPSLSLAIGTWLVIGNLTVVSTAASNSFTTEILSGATTVASSGTIAGVNTIPTGCVVIYTVVLAAITTVKVSVTNTNAGGTIKAAAPFAGVGNNASSLVCIKIA